MEIWKKMWVGVFFLNTVYNFASEVSVIALLLCLQYFDTVGWIFWPVETVAHITYTVLVEKLNHAINYHCLIASISAYMWTAIQFMPTLDLPLNISKDD